MGQSKIHIKSGVALTAIAVGLAACDVTAPSVAVPSVGINEGDRFSDGASPAAPSRMENSEWWTTFGSAELNAIVAKMRRDNPDIAAGALRVLQSELNLVTTLSRTPSVSGGASLSSTSMTDLLGDRSVDTSGELSSTVSWEADIWKRIAMQGDSASAMHVATTLDQDALVNSLIANVLRQYISLSFTRRDIAATRRVISTRQASLSITEERFELGVESTDAGSVNSAIENLASAEADLPRLELDVIQAINAIDALTGVVPTSRTTIRGQLPANLPSLGGATGTPAQLLDRRPDVRSAAARLQAANANIGVSVAERFPSLSLGATFRSGGADLSDILDVDNIVATLAADLMLTIFDGGRGSRLIEIRQAEAEELAHTYVATVLGAINEVEDLLAAERQLARQASKLNERLEAARNATEIATARYRDGTGAYLTLLDSSRSETNAETALIAVERNRWLNRVDLMLALGGRWSSN